MLGLMQTRPLMISSLLEHAATYHADREIVSRMADGAVLLTRYGELHQRAKQAANAIQSLGVRPGDRVATLAWNTHRHLTLYYAVSGAGAVLHTVDPHLPAEQIEYVVNHAVAKVVFFEPRFSTVMRMLAPRLKRVGTFVAMTDRRHMPAIGIPNLICYEDLLDSHSADYTWPLFEENSAATLCYTPCTSGNLKGVVYSHRSTVLSALVRLGTDTLRIHSADTLLLATPMFHANACGIPYCAAMTGARLVLAGPQLDGESLYRLLRDEKVTFCQSEPSVWLRLCDYLDANRGIDARSLALDRICMGGAATPRKLLERLEHDLGVEVQQFWGTAETSAIGTAGKLLPRHASLSGTAQAAVKMKQGRGLWGVELKIVDDDSRALPWDGQCFGQLYARGPWISSGYFPYEPGSALDAGGWLATGDVASIDPDGYVQFVGRTTDIIRSGGEWISSVDLENAACTHPAVAEAAIIGASHPKWQERPLLIIVKRGGTDVTREDLLAHLRSRVAKWWIPDDVIFVEELPRTAAGELMKNKLRERYRAHILRASAPDRQPPREHRQTP
ncbi:long-chain fatty acid--CoA ligase [Cupriavidus sp. CP313]